MLTLEIQPVEYFDEREETFKTYKGHTLVLEHSLVSVSKWESKWCVPFLATKAKTEEQTIDYVKCMTLTQNVSDDVYAQLTAKNYLEIKEYIDSAMSATTIAEQNNRSSHEIITSEIIYYWMIALKIPFECQKWHLNRLLMLIKVCSIKQEKPKIQSGRSLAQRNSALNAQRKAQMKTKG